MASRVNIDTNWFLDYNILRYPNNICSNKCSLHLAVYPEGGRLQCQKFELEKMSPLIMR